MTLIVQITDLKREEAIFFSDCLVSSVDRSRPAQNMSPLHRDSGWNIDTLGNFLTSKIFRSERKFVFCSGRMANFEPIAEDWITDDSMTCTDFLKIVQSENAAANSESYIFGQIIGDKMISSSFKCRRAQFGNFEITAGGSGSNYFLDRCQAYFVDDGSPAIMIAADCLAMLHAMEFSDYDFPKMRFGSGYELFAFNGSEIRRIPYAVLDFLAERLIDTPPTFKSTINKIIVCCPHEWGTTFSYVTPFKFDELRTTFIKETWSDVSAEQVSAELPNVLANFKPSFCVQIARHWAVNWSAAPREVLKIEVDVESGAIVFGFDAELVDRVWNHTLGEPD